MIDPKQLIVEAVADAYYVTTPDGDTEYMFTADTFEMIEAARVFNDEVLSYIPSWKEKVACLEAITKFERRAI